MKITILNGNPEDQANSFDGYLNNLQNMLNVQGHNAATLQLRELDLRFCTGCFGCWIKTPGQCVVKDDSHQVCRAIIQSDLILWASPLKMGFPSALLKKSKDKIIPLIHPYFEVANNEVHHRARYDRYPLVGLLVAEEKDTDETDLRILSDIFSRAALNFKSRLAVFETTSRPVEEVALAVANAKNTIVAFTDHHAPTTGTGVLSPQRLTVFNGSPRGAKGNTLILLGKYLQGFMSHAGKNSELLHINHLMDLDRQVEAFKEAECVLLGFPLYTDAMPGMVKRFVEALEPLKGRPDNPPIGFLVQSGFPEAAHSRYVERYLEKLAGRLGSPYLGTIVKGGAEGIQTMPENMTRKLYERMTELGRRFAGTGRLDPHLLRQLGKPERYPAYLAPAFKLFTRLPIASFHWDNQLKQNNAYEVRFARPFITEES